MLIPNHTLSDLMANAILFAFGLLTEPVFWLVAVFALMWFMP
jgi:hypothetical protein